MNQKNNLSFPIESFPKTLQAFTKKTAASIGVDVSYPGTIILSVISGLIGRSAGIKLKDGYMEIAPIWTALVAPSGNAKTPVFNTTMEIVKLLQSELDSKYDEESQLYKRARIRYEVEMSRWKKEYQTNQEAIFPEEPNKPFRRQLLLNDVSLCSLLESIHKYAVGSLLYQDELSGLLKSLDKSNGGKKELSHYLSLFSGTTIRYSRKGDEDLIISHPKCCVTGTIQPKMLREIARKNSQLEDSGLLSRFLYCCNEGSPIRWSKKTVSQKTRKEYERLARILFMMRESEYFTKTFEIVLHDNAYALWEKFCNDLTDKQKCTNDDFIRSGLAKFPIHAARIILTLHVLKCAEASDVYSDWPHEVDEETITNAIHLIDWFEGELYKVAALIQGKDLVDLEVTKWILNKIDESENGMSLNELHRSCRQFNGKGGAEKLERKLCEMVREGLLSRVSRIAKNGRGVEFFLSLSSPDSDEIPEKFSPDSDEDFPESNSPPVDTIAENAEKNEDNIAESVESIDISIHHDNSRESCRSEADEPSHRQENCSNVQGVLSLNEQAAKYVAGLSHGEFLMKYKLFLDQPLPPEYNVPRWFETYDPEKKAAIVEQLIIRKQTMSLRSKDI